MLAAHASVPSHHGAADWLKAGMCFLPTFYPLQGEEETSSANYGSNSRGAATTEGTSPQDCGPSGSPPAEEEAPEKGAAAADDLRDLAAKGLCAPLWRTNQPLQPVCARACSWRLGSFACISNASARVVQQKAEHFVAIQARLSFKRCTQTTFISNRDQGGLSRAWRRRRCTRCRPGGAATRARTLPSAPTSGCSPRRALADGARAAVPCLSLRVPCVEGGW